MPADSFSASGTLTVGCGTYRIFRLDAVEGAARLPFCLKILLENLLRNEDGRPVTAAITSCTNTSNPEVMIAAALLAKKAAERGLAPKPWVKTSLTPGSRVVMDYYDRAGLTPYLDKLGFNLVGYGRITCIGNSGPLNPAVSAAIAEGPSHRLLPAPGHVHPRIRAGVRPTSTYVRRPPFFDALAAEPGSLEGSRATGRV